jgi:superoxide dismutase, Cu-Zn family
MHKNICVIAACLFVAAFQCPRGQAQGMSHNAVAILKPTEGSKVKGTVQLNEIPPEVRIVADVTGLSPGKHGFHIHEKGDCSSPDASSAGGHFNPDNMKHGGPDASEHHMGDLGNIEARANGRAHYERTVNFLEIAVDPNTIDGKAIIVHAQEDDLHTQPTGNSGARLACGIIRKKN